MHAIISMSVRLETAQEYTAFYNKYSRKGWTHDYLLNHMIKAFKKEEATRENEEKQKKAEFEKKLDKELKETFGTKEENYEQRTCKIQTNKR